MPQYCLLFYAVFAILATQRGKHGTMPPPPKYAPGCLTRKTSVYIHYFQKLQCLNDRQKFNENSTKIISLVLALIISVLGSKGSAREKLVLGH